MQLTQFDYNLPEDKIAKFPPEKRGGSRLLVIDRKTGKFQDKKYPDMVEYMTKGDVLVINTTKVEKVRVFFNNPRNGKPIEALFLNKVFRGNDQTYETWEAILGRAKYVEDGDELISKETGAKITVEKRLEGSIFIVQLHSDSDVLFMQEGHVPLPPYLKREDQEDDYIRYNTVFAKQVGSSAAPTSGLNMTDQMLEALKHKGVEIVEVQLNVGWGTFAPIRTEDVEDHKIHEEYITVTQEAADRINTAKQNGGEIWSLGTTATRTLETVADKNGVIHPYKGNTDIYIYPGYKWKVVNHMITNFHAPKSSLIVMISAFMGYDLTMEAYQYAINGEYLFLSYGDSMLII